MKKVILVLAAMLMATTSYNQTSRRSANSNTSADNNRTRSTYTKPDRNSSRTTRVNSDRTNSTRTVESNRNSSNRSATVTITASTNSNSRTTARNRDTRNTSQDRHSVNNRDSYTTTNADRHSVNRHSSNNQSTRTVYASSPSSRVYRGHHHTTYVYHTPPKAKSYRVKHYSYRAPVHVDIVWTRDMHRNYLRMYPDFHYHNYKYGYRINSISAYHADYYVGDVKNVYGKITEVFYSRESDEYFLYVGPHYPYHDFTIVVPGYIARKYSRRPEYFFNHEYVNVTGLITAFDGKPEIVVKRDYQINIY